MGESADPSTEATTPEEATVVEDDTPDMPATGGDVRDNTSGDDGDGGDGVADVPDTGASGDSGFEFSSTCPHLYQANPNKLKSMVFGSGSVCVHCIGSMRNKQKNKHDNKKGQKGGKKNQQKPKKTSEDGGLWICATCGNIGCGRDSPWKHAEEHSKSGNRHQLAIQWEPRTLMVWCYECDDEVFVDESVPHTNIRNCLTILQGGVPPPTAKETEAMSKRDKRKQEKMLQQLDKKARQQQWQQNARAEKAAEKESTYDVVGGPIGKGIKGLANLGNTCFFNSVLQNLSHTRLVLDYYLTKENESPIELQGPMNLAMQEAMNLIWTEGKGTKFSPGNLFNAIAKQFVMFRRKQQQDAHELLCCLLDGLASEEKQAKKGRAFTRSTFGGFLSSTVTCHECHTASRTWEPYYILSLPIPLDSAQTQAAYNHEVRVSSAKLRRQQERALKTKQRQQAASDARAIATGEKSPTSSTDATTPSDTPTDAATPSTEGETATEETGASTSTTSSLATDVSGDSNSTPSVATEVSSDTAPKPSSAAPEESVNNTASAPQDTNSTTKETSSELSNSVAKASASEPPKDKKPTIQGPVDLRQWNGPPLKRVKGALTVLDCMLSFTDPETLEGLNAFGCSECTKQLYGDQLDEVEELDLPVEEVKSNDGDEVDTPKESADATEESKKDSESAESENKVEIEPSQEQKSAEEGNEKKDGQENPQVPDEPSNKEEEFVEFKGKKKKNKNKQAQPSKPPTPAPSSSSSSSSTPKKKLVTCTATKQFLVSTPPPVLVLHLKRFMQVKASLHKISQNVSFPATLDISPFLDHFQKDPEPSSSTDTTPKSPEPSSTSTGSASTEYKLTGVVEHSGSMSGGHYVAYFYNDADDKWYYASDTHVSVSSLESALNSEAYMLFYRRIQP